MRVGVFLEDLPPQIGGGYTIQADILQSLLDLAGESRHTFTVLCRRPQDLAVALKFSPLRAAPFPGTLARRIVSRASRELASWRGRQKARNRLEHVAREEGIEFIWFVGAEAVQVDLPYCAIVWDLQHRLQPWFPEVSAGGQWDHREIFYSRFLRRAAVIIASTQAGRREIERFYDVPAERIRVLPHPTPRFALEARPGDDDQVLVRYGLEAGYLFYPAQFWPHKNHANLLFAVARLREEHALSLEVVFAGSDKGNKDYVRDLANGLGLNAQVHFLGFVSQGDLAALYRKAFALTYLSFFGPENLPPLEAFALGCPVIAADVPGSAEQLGDAALLVDPKDVEQIAAAIKSLHDDVELPRRLVVRGRDRALARTGNHFVRGVFSFLDEFENVRRCWPR